MAKLKLHYKPLPKRDAVIKGIARLVDPGRTLKVKYEFDTSSRPGDSVEKAWANVGRYLRSAMSAYEAETKQSR